MIETVNAYLSYVYENVTLEFVVKFFVVYFFIIWIALIVWVMKDISIRTNNIFFQLLCILIVLVLTPLGIFIYLLVRPGKTLYERYYDEIDLNLDIVAEMVEERKKLMEIEKKANSQPKKDILQEAEQTEKLLPLKEENKKKIFGNTKKREEKKVTKKEKTQIKVKKF